MLRKLYVTYKFCIDLPSRSRERYAASRDQRSLNEGSGKRNSSGDPFAIFKKGSGANGVPTACGKGAGRVTLSLALRMVRNFGKGTHNLANGTRYISDGTPEPRLGPCLRRWL